MIFRSDTKVEKGRKGFKGRKELEPTSLPIVLYISPPFRLPNGTQTAFGVQTRHGTKAKQLRSCKQSKRSEENGRGSGCLFLWATLRLRGIFLRRVGIFGAFFFPVRRQRVFRRFDSQSEALGSLPFFPATVVPFCLSIP